MNYTQSQQMLHIFKELSKHLNSMADMELFIENLSTEIKNRSDRASKMRTTSTSWEATQSEWDFIHALQGLAVVLETKEKSTIEKFIIETSSMLNEQMPPIKIVFFAQEYSLWPSFQTVWDHFQEIPMCQTKLVLALGGLDQNSLAWIKQTIMQSKPEYLKHGYPVTDMQDFDVSKESPDVVFYMKPYLEFRGCPERLYVKELNKHTHYSVFVSYCLDVQGGPVLQRYFYALPAFYHMWRIVGYSNFYVDMMKKYGYRNADNVRLLGHPKFDKTYKALTQREYINTTWQQKIHSRPVVLWNSHFSIAPGKGVGTYFT